MQGLSGGPPQRPPTNRAPAPAAAAPLPLADGAIRRRWTHARSLQLLRCPSPTAQFVAAGHTLTRSRPSAFAARPAGFGDGRGRSSSTGAAPSAFAARPAGFGEVGGRSSSTGAAPSAFAARPAGFGEVGGRSSSTGAASGACAYLPWPSGPRRSLRVRPASAMGEAARAPPARRPRPSPFAIRPSAFAARPAGFGEVGGRSSSTGAASGACAYLPWPSGPRRSLRVRPASAMGEAARAPPARRPRPSPFAIRPSAFAARPAGFGEVGGRSSSTGAASGACAYLPWPSGALAQALQRPPVRPVAVSEPALSPQALGVRCASGRGPASAMGEAARASPARRPAHASL
eukprot:tig00021038_g17559.t1